MIEARLGRLKCLLELSKEGELTHENKVKFRGDLEILISNGEGRISDNDLAWCYSLRASVFSGNLPNVTERQETRW